MLAYVAVAILALIAVLHSVLGEAALLRPLFLERWELPIPRFAAERILRFAWHLTSVAWVGIAAAVAGVPLVHAAVIVCALSGAVIFVALRGHLAWPMFLATAALLALSEGVLPPLALQGLVWTGAAVAAAVAGVHVYWAAGGRWGMGAVVPQRADGSPAFSPGPVATLGVAVACAVLAGLLLWPSFAAVPGWARIGLWVAMGVFALRAIGDGRQVGFSKSNRETAFAQADDAIYSPLVVGLGFACGAALALA